MTKDHLIFNRARVQTHRERAARMAQPVDFLLEEMTSRLCERLEEFTRTFPTVLDLGAHHGLFGRKVSAKAGIETLVQSDMSQSMVKRAVSLSPHPNPPPQGGRELLNGSPSQGRRDDFAVVADEEWLPFADDTFDLVVSIGSLHWVNDLPGTLVQIRRILKPDGVFMAMLPGGEALRELRQSLEQAEMEASGGVSPRISPFVDVRDAGSLLQRAGFAMPVADSDVIEVEYTHPLKLMHDLQHMGEANALLHSRKHFTSCQLIMLAADHYLRHFMQDSGRVKASFEMVTMTGWKPVA